MISQEKVVLAIVDGRIYGECSHREQVDKLGKNTYALFCKNCDKKLYNIETEHGTYHVTFKELKVLIK
jgi:hypothetical protein